MTPQTLVILSTARSGTHLLSHEVAGDGQIGKADEYFHRELMSEFAESYGADPSDLSGYWKTIAQATAGTSGVAAVVVFPVHIEHLAENGALTASGTDGLAELLSIMDDPAVVVLERRSLVDQTLSFNRATQTDVWTFEADDKPPSHPPYDTVSLLAHLLRLQATREWVLEAERSLGDRVVARLTYENLVADPLAVSSSVLTALGLTPPLQRPAIDTGPIRLADTESTERRQKLIADIDQIAPSLGWKAIDGRTGASAFTSAVAQATSQQLRLVAEAHASTLATLELSTHASGKQASLAAIPTRFARLRGEDVTTVRVLQHGVSGAYRAAMLTDSHHHEPRFVDTWAALEGAGAVHIDTTTFGWSNVKWEQKARRIEQALATLDALHHRQVPIIWSCHTPLLPGTRHVKLERRVCQKLCDVAAIIHVADDQTLDALHGEASLDPDQAIAVGEPPVGSVPVRSEARAELGVATSDLLVVVPGPLDTTVHLRHLAALQLSLQHVVDGVAHVVVTSNGTKSRANEMHKLAQSGATVIRGELSPSDELKIIAAADVVVLGEHNQGLRSPRQIVVEQVGTPILHPTATARERFWSDIHTLASSVLSTAGTQPAPAAGPVVTLASLLGLAENRT